ncbi:WIAG-tail domain [Paenibacillus sp. DMB20]|uniref:WIAG-tail domain n=1 Tax=Paenibacillus sp. DMB20 TaxID=1642570 RepID=UPI0006281F63|nr:WIAG-tail domain [Paenibacillus sp. DMB20]KKO50819.1 hypothetical protein XI25_30445 [Paenibacillus sp. DMB20]
MTAEALASVTIQDGSISGAKLEDGTITGQQLAAGAVTSGHLAPGAVNPQHLSFAPIRSSSDRTAVQQYGFAAFVFQGAEDQTEVTVTFGEAFAVLNYVIVAMSNHPGFQVCLKQQRAEEAALTVIRQPGCTQSYGFISWIAIGPSL